MASEFTVQRWYKTATKHQALVSSSFIRLNHVHWTKSRNQVTDTNINVQTIQHKGIKAGNIMTSLFMKTGNSASSHIKFTVYATSWAFQ